MEKIFLDTNTFIDILEDRDPSLRDMLAGNALYISTASIPIWVYVYKLDIDQINKSLIFEVFNLVSQTVEITKRAFTGPLKDYEDNIQLHSAAVSECSVFLTNDKEVLDLGYFGDMKIVSPSDLVKE